MVQTIPSTNVVKESLPKYSEIRGLLINSKDPNQAGKLLGKPSEVWNKRLITYSLYYHSATHNGKKGHIMVTYDNGSGLLGKVEDISFHNLGDKIAVGNYSFVKSPN